MNNEDTPQPDNSTASPILNQEPQENDFYKNRYSAIIWTGGIVMIILGITTIYLRDPHHANSYPSCPFYYFTGFYCPGCGSMRATHCMLHGDFLSALNRNPLAVLLLPIAAWGFVVDFENRWLSRQRIPPLPLIAPIIILILVITFWIARNIPIFPFTLLAPH